MEILNFPPVSVELEMTTTAEGNPPFCRDIMYNKYMDGMRKQEIF